MQYRILQIAALAFLFAFAPHIAPPLAAAEAGDDKAAFRVAYKAYQAAVEAKDADAAVTAAEEALELGKSVFPDDSPSLPVLYINYGKAILEAAVWAHDFKNREAVIEPFEEAINRYESLYGENDGRLIDPLRWLADVHSRFSQHDDEIEIRERVLLLVEVLHGGDSYAFAEASMETGRSFYSSYRRYKSAPRHFQIAYDIYGHNDDTSGYKLGLAAFWLGKAAEQSRKRKFAEERYLEALDIFEETSPPGHELQILAHTYLIKLYEERGKGEEAALHCQAISRLRPLVGVDGYQPLYIRHPVYPRSALRAERSGYVLVDFTVTTSGTVANASVVESKGGRGKEFEHAALEALSYFRYAPAVQDGKLVETTGVRNVITFEIDD